MVRTGSPRGRTLLAHRAESRRMKSAVPQGCHAVTSRRCRLGVERRWIVRLDEDALIGRTVIRRSRGGRWACGAWSIHLEQVADLGEADERPLIQHSERTPRVEAWMCAVVSKAAARDTTAHRSVKSAGQAVVRTCRLPPGMIRIAGPSTDSGFGLWSVRPTQIAGQDRYCAGPDLFLFGPAPRKPHGLHSGLYRILRMGRRV